MCNGFYATKVMCGALCALYERRTTYKPGRRPVRSTHGSAGSRAMLALAASADLGLSLSSTSQVPLAHSFRELWCS